MTNDIYRKLSLTAYVKRIASITASILRKKSITSKIDLQEIDVTLPTLQSATVEDAFPTQIELLFDLALDTTSQPAYTDFTVTVNGVDREVIGVSFDITGFRVYVSVLALSYGDVITVAYTQGSNPLRTISLLRVQSFTATAVTNNIAGSNPILQSITVSDSTPTKIDILYDLDLDETSVPETTDFVVAGRTVSAVSVSEKTVILTVTSRYYWGDTDTVAYTKGSNPIQTGPGSEADSFTATALTNNVALDSATTTLITASRYTTAPSDALKALINKTIVDLKADGVFALGDCMYVRGVHEAVFACQNWIKNAHNSTLVNSPTFTAKEGFQGNGSTMYINNNYTPSSEAENYQINSSSIVIMHNAIGTTTGRDPFGAYDGVINRAYMLFYTGGTTERMYFNSVSYNNVVELTNGLYLGYTRYLDTTPYVQAYSNGLASGVPVSAVANSGLVTVPFFELAVNNNGSPASYYNGKISFHWIGAELSAAQQLALYTRLAYFFANVGGTF